MQLARALLRSGARKGFVSNTRVRRSSRRRKEKESSRKKKKHTRNTRTFAVIYGYGHLRDNLLHNSLASLLRSFSIGILIILSSILATWPHHRPASSTPHNHLLCTVDSHGVICSDWEGTSHCFKSRRRET